MAVPRFFIVTAIAGACVIACSSSYSGSEAPDADGGDGSTPESSSGGPAADASTDGAPDTSSDAGAPNLLTNGDFELGCAGWEVSFGFISDAPTHHAGGHSCKVCMDTNFEASLEQELMGPVAAGESFFGEVWMRDANIPTGAGFNGDALVVFDDNHDFSTDGPFPLTPTWVRLTTIFKAPVTGTKVGLRIHLQQDGNPAATGNVICVYVDDAVLRRMP